MKNLPEKAPRIKGTPPAKGEDGADQPPRSEQSNPAAPGDELPTLQDYQKDVAKYGADEARRRWGVSAPQEATQAAKTGKRQAAAVRPATPASNEPKVETFTAGQLLRMHLPEPKWGVKGIVAEGLNILAGKPKMGKSFLALGIALAVADGGVALGSIAVNAGAVLYLALEDTKRRLKERVAKIQQRQGGSYKDNLVLARDWPRADRGGLEEIEKWLASHPDARLVVIDTLARFRPVRLGRRNDYEVDYEDVASLKSLADRGGLAFLVLHHTRKMAAADPLEEVSGTLGLSGAADGILVLRRERGQHDAALCITGRDVEERELALRWDAEFCLWSILGEAQEYRVTTERAEVLRVLTDAGRPLSPAQVAPLLQKRPNATRVLLWTMAKAGQLRSLGRGLYTPTNTHNNTHNANTPNTANGGVSGGPGSTNADEDIQSPF